MTKTDEIVEAVSDRIINCSVMDINGKMSKKIFRCYFEKDVKKELQHCEKLKEKIFFWKSEICRCEEQDDQYFCRTCERFEEIFGWDDKEKKEWLGEGETK